MLKDTLVAVVGASGTGKTTLLKSAFKSDYDKYHVVTNTTRAMRPGERDGIDYHFQSEFKSDENTILSDTYAGNHYWTNKSDLIQQLKQNHFAMMVVTAKGLKQLLSDPELQSAIVGLVLKSDTKELADRLKSRDANNSEIKIRIDNLEQDNKTINQLLTDLKSENMMSHIAILKNNNSNDDKTTEYNIKLLKALCKNAIN